MKLLPQLVRFVLPVLVLFSCAASFAASSADRTQFGSDIHVQAGEKTADVTCINCSVYVRGQVSGDVTALEGTKWLLAIIVPPIIFVGGVIALIIWLVQRNRTGAPAPVYVQPGGQPSTRI